MIMSYRILRKLAAVAMSVMIAVPVFPVYAENEDNADFDAFLQEEYVDAMEQDYMSMHFGIRDYQKYGIEKPETTIGDATLQSYADAAEDGKASLEKLESFDYDSLSDRQKHDYDAYHFYLKHMIALNEYPMEDQIFSDSAGIISNLLTNFTEFIFYEKQDFDDYLDVLASVPQYIDEALETTKAQAEKGLFLTDSQLDDTEDSIDKFCAKTDDNQLIVIFEENVDAADYLTDAEKEDYKARNRDLVLNSYIPAYQKAGQELEKLRGSRSYEGGYANYGQEGKDYYTELAQYKCSSDKSVQELFDLCNDYTISLVDDYIELYQKDPSAMDKAETETIDDMTPEEVLSYLQGQLQDYPEGPEVTYKASYLDPSVANDTTMAYYMEPPIDDIKDNVIKINGDNVSDTTTMYTTLAHEGFPGHLYQITWYLNTNPSMIRSATGAIGYTEGWAMTAEQNALMHSTLSETAQQLQWLNTAVGYTYNAAADLAVNGLGYTESELAKWMADVGLNEDAAQSLYNYVVDNPGLILPYGCGLAQFMMTQKDAEDRLGNAFDLEEYHEVLLENGDRPFESVSADVEAWIESKGVGKEDLFGNNDSSTTTLPSSHGQVSFFETKKGHIVIFSAIGVVVLVVLLALYHDHKDDPLA